MERPHLKAGLTRLGLAADRLRTDRVGPRHVEQNKHGKHRVGATSSPLNVVPSILGVYRGIQYLTILINGQSERILRCEIHHQKPYPASNHPHGRITAHEHQRQKFIPP